MIDPEIRETPAQLPLPSGFLEPQAPRPAPATPTSPVPEAAPDPKIDALIDHFRTLERDAEIRHRPQDTWFQRVARHLHRTFLAVLHGAAPPPVESSKPWPRISIVIPFADETDRVEHSIAALRDQAYPDLEIILVSGLPAALCQKRLHSQADHVVIVPIDRTSSLAAMLRRGLARASGEVLGWIAGGTISLPGTLDRVGTFFRDADVPKALHFDVVQEVNGWRFAAPPGLDPAGLFFARLGYDVIGGLAVEDEAATAATLAADMIKRFVGRYRLDDLPVHAAVVSAGPADLSAATRPDAPFSAVRTRRCPFWYAPESPDGVPTHHERIPVTPTTCPVSGDLPDRFLFATPDTRYGTPGLHDVWFHAATHCVTMAPAATRADVRRLGAQQPPLADRRIIEPKAGAPSPWRDWTFGGRALAAALRHPLPGWLLDRWPLKRFIGWTDRTGMELERMVQGLLRKPAAGSIGAARILEIGCHSGDVLDHLSRRGWTTFGTEINVGAAEAARSRGHTIWVGAPDDLLQTVPVEERFDVVFLGHVVERQADPLALMQRAARLLKPTGLLVVATPNLSSAQIDLFGPTWAHWHPPFHRAVLSRRALTLMAAASGLRARRFRSWSHPYWSWLSVRLNSAGLAGIVPNGVVPDPERRSAVETLIVLTRLLYDWRGRGDYLYGVFSPDLTG